MSDRELLELAAKAAGIDVRYIESWGGHFIHRPHKLPGEWDRWNPLANDGQALRLAVKLRIDIEHMQQMHGQPCGVSCHPKGRGDCQVDERNDSDPYAATRHAIVRAAAAIGKEVP